MAETRNARLVVCGGRDFSLKLERLLAGRSAERACSRFTIGSSTSSTGAGGSGITQRNYFPGCSEKRPIKPVVPIGRHEDFTSVGRVDKSCLVATAGGNVSCNGASLLARLLDQQFHCVSAQLIRAFKCHPAGNAVVWRDGFFCQSDVDRFTVIQYINRLKMTLVKVYAI